MGLMFGLSDQGVVDPESFREGLTFQLEKQGRIKPNTNNKQVFADREYPALTLQEDEERRIELFNLMVKYKADVTFEDFQGFNLLHFAVIRGWLPVVKTLVKKGLDPTKATQTNKTPLMLSIEHKHV